jgi:hypothetical protein
MWQRHQHGSQMQSGPVPPASASTSTAQEQQTCCSGNKHKRGSDISMASRASAAQEQQTCCRDSGQKWGSGINVASSPSQSCAAASAPSLSQYQRGSGTANLLQRERAGMGRGRPHGNQIQIRTVVSRGANYAVTQKLAAAGASKHGSDVRRGIQALPVVCCCQYQRGSGTANLLQQQQQQQQQEQANRFNRA